ncbi:hypothetical protein DFH08DRAFT_795880 [Mycena albidolilacea]|uniref:VASt domain-containing protein n=1 Tax=Mycena albidolilacea TaxID=1033008 RepID=A0AAD7F3P5_9AGAR|nr:hypothetical protein DFH08DRAFT_795880 [Mycena albidolilacea]
MAPNFLSKLVKSPTTSQRDRSLSSPSPPSSSRSRTPSSLDNATMPSLNSSTFSSVPSVTVNTTDKPMYNSGNPSVTVIPPSPDTNKGDVPELPTYRPTSQSNGQKVDGSPVDSSPKASQENTKRTPSPDRPIPPAPAAPAQKSSERTPQSSPRASTNNLPSVRHQTSNKSLKQQQQEQLTPLIPPVPPLPRASTAAPAANNPHSDDEERPTLTESPTEVQAFPQVSHATTWAPSARRDTDVFSVTSQGQKKKSTRPWRRSTPKKPMGLASAIAASGLAMANPAMTAPQQSNLTPQVMNQNENKSGPSLVTSPNQNPNRKLTTSPEMNPANHRRYVTNENGRSPRAKSEHKRRRTTGSVSGHGHGGEGEYFPDEQGEYYSGLEESSDEGSGSDSDDESGSGLEDLDLGEDDIPVTGFAVASNKRNADFHELFPGIPEGDYLIDDYGCALQREILIQGRIYVSENHLCFHANIFGWVTDLSIPIYEITTLEKRMTAFVIPNAIRVKTHRADYTFASFLSRDTTFDVIHNIWRLARPGDAASIGSGSGGNVINIAEGTVIGGGGGGGGGAVAAAGQGHKPTTCACGKEGSHFAEVAMDTVVPGTPDRIYNLMFASGFMKDFMAVNQKLLDIQVADWAPTTPGSQLLARNMSYIKPLTASLGPKQTKCEIRDENVHLNFDDYVSTLTTTRNPDVPSGGVFSVKTRTCLMWASPLTTRIIVSTQVDWTGRSFIKGIIERSAIDGQKVYHADLEKAMRTYISEHQSEFMPEGVEVVLPEPTPDVGPASPGVAGAPISEKQREKERNQRGMQWAWDTFDGAAQVAKQSTKGLLELIHDGWEHSTSKTILYAVIILLIFSNIWTYMRAGGAAHSKTKKELAKAEDKDQFLAGVVTALFDELASGKLAAVTSAAAPPGVVPTTVVPPAAVGTGLPSVSQDLKLELGVLQTTLDTVEERVRRIRESLKEIESLNDVV